MFLTEVCARIISQSMFDNKMLEQIRRDSFNRSGCNEIKLLNCQFIFSLILLKLDCRFIKVFNLFAEDRMRREERLEQIPGEPASSCSCCVETRCDVTSCNLQCDVTRCNPDRRRRRMCDNWSAWVWQLRCLCTLSWNERELSVFLPVDTV